MNNSLFYTIPINLPARVTHAAPQAFCNEVIVSPELQSRFGEEISFARVHDVSQVYRALFRISEAWEVIHNNYYKYDRNNII